MEEFENDQMLKLEHISSLPELDKVSLTPYQATLYYDWQQNPDRTNYNLISDLFFDGNFDKERLNKTLIRFINDYLLFNSNVAEQNGSLYWIQRKPIDTHTQIVNYCVDALTDEQLLTLVDLPFDLETDRLARFYLVRYTETKYRLIYVVQHIIIDGACTDFFLTEIARYYNDKTYKQPISTDQQVFLHKGLSAHFDLLMKKNAPIMNAFWAKRLSGVAGIDLNFLRSTPKFFKKQDKISVQKIRFEFTEAEVKQVKQLSRLYRLTPYIYGQLIFGILLYRMTGQESFGISFPVAIPEGKELIYGAQINTIVIDYKIGDQTTLSELISRTLAFFDDLKASKGRYLPVSDIMKHVSNKTVLDTCFIQTNLRDLLVSYDGVNEIFPLDTLFLDISGKLQFEQELRDNRLNYRVRYDGNTLDAQLVHQFTILYQRLFKSILSDLLNNAVEQKIDKYILFDISDRKKIIYDWNATAIVYPDKKTVNVLFEEQVLRTPDQIAVVSGNNRISYKELNERSNQLAHYLRKHYDIKPDALVILCLDRSAYMLISILGILKAGGAYVPSDPGYPRERLCYMIRDTRSKIVLTNEKYESLLSDLQLEEAVGVLSIDSAKMEEELRRYPLNNPGAVSSSSDLAYVIYTSGTTGQPKGVMVEHRNVVNRITWMNKEYPLHPNDRILQKTPFIFDVSVWELFWANWYGACIIFAQPDGHKDNEYLSTLIEEERITIIHFVPTMLSAFENALENNIQLRKKVQTLRYIFCSGETLTPQHVQKSHALLPEVQIYNLYGPTETSVDVLFYDCNRHGINHVLIGRPISNTTAYILDQCRRPLPVGAIGELYIGGSGVARGYLNREELTNERFIVNPFQQEEEKKQGYNHRLYKTGDLARYHADGNIEYIGRNDFQVKIRGYRIELGEIESTLIGYAGITQSVVTVHEPENGHKYLVGYYVSSEMLNAVDIENYLSERLPDYMMPSVLVHLKELPLTVNGKLDRRALPVAELQSGNAFQEPYTALQKHLCAIWGDILGLDAEHIGIDDDFFRLGGDSIMAARLVSKINKIWKSSLRVMDVFVYRNVALLSVYLEGNKNEIKELGYKEFNLIDVNAYADKIDLRIISDIYPASYLQMGMLYEAEGHNNSTYHYVFRYRIDAAFVVTQFENLWQQLVIRHELLRASFILSDNGYDCIIYKHAIPEIQIVSPTSVDTLIDKERLNRFPYEKPGLFRLIVSDLDGQFDMFFSFHHAICDGWSVASLMNEFIKAYIGNVKLEKQSELRYGEYIASEQQALTVESEGVIDFWKAYLQDASLVRFGRSEVRRLVNADVTNSKHILNEEGSRRIISLSSVLEASTDIIFMYAYLHTIGCFLNSEDITIGLVVNNRIEREGGDELFGLFLNTIPFRYQLDLKNGSSLKVIEELFKSKIELYKYKSFPYGKLKSLFDSELYCFAFNFVHFHVLKESQNNIVQMSAYERTNIPFFLNIVQDNDLRFHVEMTSSAGLMSEGQLDSFMQYYLHSLNCILNNRKINNILQDTSVPYRQLFKDWNGTRAAYPADKTLHALFEEQVAKTPEAIALVYEDKELTYGDLNARSNRLAHCLIGTYGIHSDDLVLLCLDRSEHLLIGILGVLKAGGAYVPMDAGYPGDRKAYMIQDTGARVIVTHEVYVQVLQELSGENGSVLSIDGESQLNELMTYPQTNPVTVTQSDHLAYVIYTSGTTGRPKGVMVEHRSVVNTIWGITAAYDFTLGAKVTAYTSYVFDVSVSEFFVTLLHGEELHLLSEQKRTDVEELSEYILGNSIQCIYLPPAVLSLLPKRSYPSLKTIIYAGEPCDKKTGEYWSEQICLYNYYGPTEATIYATGKQVINGDVELIGRPIGNTSVYVLDKNGGLLPVGAIGELYIGGVGVSRGYLNQEGLTKERFILNPFQSEEEKGEGYNGRLYKTGDLVRYHADGSLEYLGRSDDQVKVRGYRIELGEIESVISSYGGISQSVVVVKDDHEHKYLVGYYVGGSDVMESGLRSHLLKVLPDYMVPVALMRIDEIPLTLNGKVDRRRLPDPLLFSGADVYLGPDTALEASLQRLWGEVLGIPGEDISTETDFFRLGGDSIVSIRLVSRIRQRLGYDLSVKEIFQHRSIRMQGLLLDSRHPGAGDTVCLEQGMLEGGMGFLPIQGWFFHRVDGGDFGSYHHWNQSFLLKVPELDMEVLGQSVYLLKGYHDMLRAGYRVSEGVYEQYYRSHGASGSSTLFYIDRSLHSEDSLHQALTEAQSGFDLFGGEDLFRVGYIGGYPGGQARIYFAFHHLIIDAVSWRILSGDLRELYKHLERLPASGRLFVTAEQILGKKGTSYREWVSAVSSYVGSSLEREYWESSISAQADLASKSFWEQSEERHEVYAVLDGSDTARLLRDSHKKYGTQMNDLLLSGLVLALGELTGISRHGVLLEGHGRNGEYLGQDLTHTVGWFTTMYPVLLEGYGSDLGRTVVSVKEQLRGIPNEGLGYGALMGYEAGFGSIVFNYLGQFSEGNTGGGSWSIVAENSGSSFAGDNQSSELLSINGGIFGGELQFRISGKVSEVQLKKLSDLYKSYLESLISYLGAGEQVYLTSSDVGYVLSSDRLSKLQEEEELEGVYQANSLQEGFIYQNLHHGSDDDAYTVQQLWDYHSDIQESELRLSWEYAQRRYSSLRLRLDWEEELLQIIPKSGVLDWRYIDMQDISAEGQANQEQAILRADREDSYDLSSGSLFRVYLIRKGRSHYSSIFSSHHAILDGWSMPILVGYVHEVYIGLLRGVHPGEGTDTSYGASQRYLQAHREDERGYWSSVLGLLEESADLSSLMEPSVRGTDLRYYRRVSAPRHQEIRIQGKTYTGLKEVLGGSGLTMNALLQYLWQKQLSIYGNTGTTVVGMTVSGRGLPVAGIEESVGLYINTLPLVHVHEEGLVLDAVHRLQSEIQELSMRSGTRLSGLHQSGDSTRGRLFSSLFVYENYPVLHDGSGLEDLQITYRMSQEKSDYVLSMLAHEHDGSVLLRLDYAGELFAEEQIEALLSGIRRMVIQLLSDPLGLRTEWLSGLSEDARAVQLEGWNRTEVAYPAEKMIHELFEDQVHRNPEGIALVYEGQSLSYGDLNGRSNRLAHYLRSEYGVKADSLVLLCLDRSFDMLVSILGVLKAGGAYVPVDPGYPGDRIGYMQEDTCSEVILTQERYAGHFTGSGVLSLDSASLEATLAGYSSANPEVINCSGDLAYVIYTSGTTGRPKGVMVEHRSVVNLLQECIKLHELKKYEHIGCYSNYVFDAFVYEMFPSLSNGNILYLYPDSIRRSLDDLALYIQDNNIEVSFLPPALLTEFINENDGVLKLIYTGGEQFPDLKKDYIKTKLINEYGPTETTVCTTLHVYESGSSNRNIGRPIGNTSVYVLDKNGGLLPVGAIGELYIGGVGVSRGYLNQEGLTKERFILNPFQSEEEKAEGYNGRLYKTGDLVRYQVDGNIEYLGRNDDQVKVRGYRIELGEIESKLNEYAGISQSVVLAKEDPGGHKYLVGYYVGEEEVKEPGLRVHLDLLLPEYMVPSFLMRIEKIPLTINGKVDRRALPEPLYLSQEDVYRGPENEQEADLQLIWGEVLGLGLEQVSTDGDFFRLGGDSIRAIKLVSRVNKTLGTGIRVSDVFRYKRIRELSLYISSTETREESITAAAVSSAEEQLLSFGQERLWVIETYEDGSKAYNNPVVIQLAQRVNTKYIELAIRAIVNRHEVLRSEIKTSKSGTGYQVVIDDIKRPLTIMHYICRSRAELDADIDLSIHKVFKLSEDYPLEVKVYVLQQENEEEVYYMSIVVHHIAFDGWSRDIFIKELLHYYKYYEGIENNLNGVSFLPELTLQYKDYALWQRRYVKTEIFEKQLGYWLRQLSNYEMLNLPLDNVRPPKIDYNGANVEFIIDLQVSMALRHVARHLGVSMFSLFLSAYYQLLYIYSGQEDIIIGTPVSNRHHQQTEELIGFFVNMLALRQKLNNELAIEEFITGVGRMVEEAQEYQDIPFAELIEALNITLDISHHPLFQVMFVLEGLRKEQKEALSDLFTLYKGSSIYSPAKVDLLLSIDDSEEEIKGEFNYAIALFEKSTIISYIDTYKQILYNITMQFSPPGNKNNGKPVNNQLNKQ